MSETGEEGRAAAHRNAAFVLALRERGLRDTAVLRAMERVPRERFAPPAHRAHARRDIALPLPCGQSMLAPTTVAAMLSLLALPPGARVLEVGTGSGYVTALLARLDAAHVLSLERYPRLAGAARAALASEPAARVEVGDGLDRDVPAERFARILVNGACRAVPERLCAALAPDGRLVAAVRVEASAGGEGTRLTVIARGADGRLTHSLERSVRLPPMTPGRALAR